MRRKVKTRGALLPDPTFNSVKVAKLINYIMERGKKNTARQIVYGALAEIEKTEKTAPLEVLETAISNVAPQMEVRSRRIGGANYQVPHEVRPERRLALALRWIIGSAKSKKGRPMKARLAEEIIAASRGEGEAVKKRENIHKMAEANRAFAHFAWSRRG
jgi:small subunit ribosomal protein S7